MVNSNQKDNTMKQTNAEATGTDSRVASAYRDYAAVNTDCTLEHLEHAIGPGGDPPFPVKLHYALKELEADNMEHIISWQSHGR